MEPEMKPDMKPVIRDAISQDFEPAASLLIQAYGEYASSMTPEHWRAMQRHLSNVAGIAGQGKLIVVEQAQTVQTLVGAVIYHPPGHSDPRLFQPEWASVRLLGVLPASRGQGIGKQLVYACIQLAKADRAQTLSLHTTELMTTAHRMYEAIGFERESELPENFGLRYWRYCLKL